MCRTAYCWILVALPLLSGLNCAILNGDEETLETPLALAFAACGPADGPAFFVYLPEAASSCGDLEALTSTYPPGEPLTRFFLFGETAPIVPSTISLEPNSSIDDGGIAERCEASGPCENAVHGTVHFNAGRTGRIEMSYDIRFEDGTRTTGQADVRICEPVFPLICG